MAVMMQMAVLSNIVGGLMADRIYFKDAGSARAQT